MSVFMTTPNVTSILHSTTTLSFNTTKHMGGELDDASKSKSVPLAIGLAVVGVLLIILAAIGCTYMYRTKRMFRNCDFWNRQRRRRLSSASSQRALDDDGTSIDIPGSRREANLFSIDDEEPRENDDGYFYDEVFERSAFVDVKTNAALKELYIASDEVPDLDFREQRY